MFALKKYTLLALLLTLMACVTINVYFPAAAAEHAADKIIRQVYGKDQETAPPPAGAEQTGIERPVTGLLAALLYAVIPPAAAQQPDINISTPGIETLRTHMQSRHEFFEKYYNSGAIGMENNGLITIHDENKIPLQYRNTIKTLVVNENKDRDAMYQELADANGHPEWEPEIRKTFARRWIDNAPSGWWYMDARGNWKQK